MIRIKDIAKEAGVSPTTVSNVIHGNHKKVSEETVERIERLLKDRDYIPSMGARMLAGGGTRVIGVLAAEPGGEKRRAEGHPFANILLRSLEREIYERNYYMLLHFTATPEEGIQFAATWNVEGLITIGFGTGDNLKLQGSCKVPIVSIDVYYEVERMANVGLDDKGGGVLMTKYLLDTGHRKIGFVSDNDVGVDHERWKGVCEACEDYGVKDACVRHIIIPEERRTRREYYRKYLAQIAAEYDALFFASDYYAVEAMAVLGDMGVRVPEDLSVAGFDDTESAVMCRPLLTTVHQEVEGKAEHAVRKLLAFIQGERKISMTERLPVTLVLRDSVKIR